MAMYKMNILHFHLSEECFRVESKNHPGLHAADCTVRGRSNDEYYSQGDIKHLVRFAQLRGIRVIPEFDIPGHATGFCLGLAAEGIQCCTGPKGMVIQDDAKSVALVQDVLDEMIALFDDDVMHIG